MLIRDIIFSYNNNLLLQFLPNFKIYKCNEDFPQPPCVIGHHPYFIEYETQEVAQRKGITSYSYELKSKPKYEDHIESILPEKFVQQQENIKTKNEILYLLNALSNSYLFYYGQHGARQSWSIGLDDDYSLRYSQEGYFSPDYERYPKEIKPQDNYEYSDPVLLHFQDDGSNLINKVTLNDLLKVYYSSKPSNLKEEYLNACIVLTKAQDLFSVDQSAAYIFMVSAIEALITIEYKDHETVNCKCCGQPMHKVSKKFKDFIDKYGYQVSNKVKNEFYEMRSSISHFGNLLSSSYAYKMFIESQEDFDQRHKGTIERMQFETFRNLAKTCFRTFLLKNISS